MQAVKCEMCNSIDVVKDGDYYVCQSCGTKYTVEAAKKLMVEGTVKIDSSEELEKLYIAARNARETSDSETAIKHYEKISSIEPNSWEALFYLIVLKTNEIKYGEIANAAISVSNCLPKVFELINNTIEDESIKKEAVAEVKKQLTKTAVFLITTNGKYYNEIKSIYGTSFDFASAANNLAEKSKAKHESAQRSFHIGNILRICGDEIEKTFGLTDEFYRNHAIDCWEAMMAIHIENIKNYKVAVYDESFCQKYIAKIKKYKPSYEVPNIKATEGRNTAIAAILIAVGALAAGILWALWIYS